MRSLLLVLPIASCMPLAMMYPNDRRPHKAILGLRGGDDKNPAAEARDKLSSWFSGVQKGGFGKAKAPLDPDRKKANELLKKRGLANAAKAADLLRAALKRDPENVDIKLELADAINMQVRIKTNACSLVLEGTQDSPAFKKIWRTLGGESYELAKEARKAYPSSVKALAVRARVPSS